VDDMLTTEQKGQIAFLKVQAQALLKNATVLLPTMPRRYDLVLQWQGRFHRCQVKYADARSMHSQGAAPLDLRKRKKTYSQAEIDAILVYLPQIDKVIWLPPALFHEKTVLYLRWLPAKNNQRRRCIMVDELVW
jgi:PD-(D/E)XK endonuclease